MLTLILTPVIIDARAVQLQASRSPQMTPSRMFASLERLPARSPLGPLLFAVMIVHHQDRGDRSTRR
jgi:hypothetical protein